MKRRDRLDRAPDRRLLLGRELRLRGCELRFVDLQPCERGVVETCGVFVQRLVAALADVPDDLAHAREHVHRVDLRGASQQVAPRRLL